MRTKKYARKVKGLQPYYEADFFYRSNGSTRRAQVLESYREVACKHPRNLRNVNMCQV